MLRVENKDGAIDGSVFVEEMHVVDETGERSQRVMFVRSVLFAFQIQITCTHRSHRADER